MPLKLAERGILKEPTDDRHEFEGGGTWKQVYADRRPRYSAGATGWVWEASGEFYLQSGVPSGRGYRMLDAGLKVERV
jgi:hypothetical protein